MLGALPGIASLGDRGNRAGTDLTAEFGSSDAPPELHRMRAAGNLTTHATEGAIAYMARAV